MRATILGMGEWLPETVRTNDAWPAEFVDVAKRMQGAELVEVTGGDGDSCEVIAMRRGRSDETDPFRGAVRRRVADETMTSSEAEALAGRAALADAGVDPADVDLVLSWAMVPDRLSPANGPKVAQLVGATRAGGVLVEAACASPIAQLVFASAMIESGRARTVLCTQSHLMNRANPLTHPASPLMGDAATALVVGASERRGVATTAIVSEGQWYDAVTWSRGRGDADVPWWQPGGAFVAGTKDRDLTHRLVKGWVRMAADTIGAALESARLTPKDLDVLAIVQPRWWLPGAVCEALGIPEERAPTTFAELAHVGGCGIVTNLLEARRRGLLREGAKVALYGIGAGITRAAAIIEWTAS